MTMRKILLFLACLPAAVPCAATAATVTVVNSFDIVNGNVSSIAALKASPGPDGISFREALLAANNDSGSNVIGFDIPPGDPNFDPSSGQWVIRPATPYPLVTVGALIIDGFTQTQSQGDRNPNGPEIRFSGTSTPQSPCFSLNSPGNGVKMLTISDFNEGILVVGNGNIVGAANEIVHNAVGVVINGDNNLVKDNGKIGDNQSHGVLIEGGNGNSVRDNSIGSNNIGVTIRGGGHDNTVGPGNEIIFNTHGVVVSGGAVRNTITQNAIYANREMGILLESGGNGQIPPPLIRYFGGVVKGKAPPGSVIEVFGDRDDPGELYPGTQGRIYLGTAVADGNGDVGLVVSTQDPFINATVTDPNGNTSQFSPPSRPILVVANSGTDERPGNTVTFVDALSFSPRETVRVGRRPMGIVGALTGHIHVVNNDDDSVSVIFDPVDTTVTGTIAAGVEPLAIAGIAGHLFVAATGPDPRTVPGSLTVIDTATLQVTRSIPVGRRPGTVRIVDIGGIPVLAVPNLYDDTLTFVDPVAQTVIKTIPAGDYPADVCAGDSGRLYVADIGNGVTDGVSVIDYASGRTLTKLSTGLGPISISKVPDRPYVAVANSVSGTVSVIDDRSARIVSTIPVGSVPTHLTIAPGKYIYVTDFASSLERPTGTVTVISMDTLSVIGTIDVGPFPNYIEILFNDEFNWFPNGIDLVASPSIVSPGGGVTLGWVVSPGLRERGDILLGVELPGGSIMAFNESRTGLSPAGPVGSIPRVARNFPLNIPAQGRLDFPVPADAAPGDYAFIAAVIETGTNRILRVVRSNRFTIAEISP